MTMPNLPNLSALVDFDGNTYAALSAEATKPTPVPQEHNRATATPAVKPRSSNWDSTTEAANAAMSITNAAAAFTAIF